jgi:hypothetical protein
MMFILAINILVNINKKLLKVRYRVYRTFLSMILKGAVALTVARESKEISNFLVNDFKRSCGFNSCKRIKRNLK